LNPIAKPLRDPSVTLSIVSHGQGSLVARLFDDLRRVQPRDVRRLVLTLNIDELDPGPSPISGCDLTVLRNDRPLGFGANHNQAFAHCDTDWFGVLNPDLRCDSDFIAPLLANAQPSDGLVAPCVYELDGTRSDSVRYLVTPLRLLRRRVGLSEERPRREEFDWMAGMCMLLRSEAFEAVGGFDQRFHMYCEDADLSLRLQLASWQIRQVSSAAVVHIAQRASGRSLQHLSWHVLSLLKHWMSATFWRYWLRRHEFRSGRRAASRAS
jgi:N-acetylglucosaminyl-diphospho-decaprenol L-rhamnosyltransferase